MVTDKAMWVTNSGKKVNLQQSGYGKIFVGVAIKCCGRMWFGSQDRIATWRPNTKTFLCSLDDN